MSRVVKWQYLMTRPYIENSRYTKSVQHRMIKLSLIKLE